MKSFTKKILVTALLLSSTSALAFSLGNWDGDLDSLKPPQIVLPPLSPVLQDPTVENYNTTQNLSWMTFAPVELRFENNSSGQASYTSTVTLQYKTRDVNTKTYVNKKQSFVLNSGEKKTLTLSGDDALVEVFAQDDQGLDILDLKMCSYNNKFYNASKGEKGLSAKIFSFNNAETVGYPTDPLRLEGYNPLNIGDASCWVAVLPPTPPA